MMICILCVGACYHFLFVFKLKIVPVFVFELNDENFCLIFRKLVTLNLPKKMASKKKLPTSFSDDYIDIITNESNQHFRQQQQQLYHNQQQQRRSQPQILPIESYSPPPLLSTAKHPTFNRRNIHIRQQIARHSHFPSYYTLNSLYSKPNFLRGLFSYNAYSFRYFIRFLSFDVCV